MRFMVLMIPKVYQPGSKVDPGFAPPAAEIEKMTKFNESLIQAGAMLSGDGLHPLTNGARVAFSGGKPVVTDGPYIEAKEVLGGYWMLQFKSKEEAVNWFKRCPAQDGDVIEIRQVFETTEFPEDAQKAADTPIIREHLEKMGRS